VAMNLADPPLLPVGLMAFAARDLAARAVDLVAAARALRLRSPLAVVVVAALGGALLDAVAWGCASLAPLVALLSMGLAATLALAVGWWSEPDEIERWLATAAFAALASGAPAMARFV
jgi:hypothetical protein